MESFAQLVPIVAPIFVCAGIGVLWAWLDRPFDAELVAKMVYNVSAPCLIIATVAKLKLEPAALAELALAALLCYAAFAALGAAVLKAARLPLPSYLPSLMFPLTGSLGLPVCYFALGDSGLAFALIYFTLGAIGAFTIGDAIAAGRVTLGKLARMPVIYAVAIAVLFMAAGWTMPAWALNTTRLLGDIVIPMQLVALGVSLSQLRAERLGRAGALAALRLGMGAAVGFGVAQALGLTGAAWAVVIIQSAMPVAVSNYLWARLYGHEREDVAGMVLVSTAMAFIGMPVLLLFVI